MGVVDVVQVVVVAGIPLDVAQVLVVHVVHVEPVEPVEPAEPVEEKVAVVKAGAESAHSVGLGQLEDPEGPWAVAVYVALALLCTQQTGLWVLQVPLDLGVG